MRFRGGLYHGGGDASVKHPPEGGIDRGHTSARRSRPSDDSRLQPLNTKCIRRIHRPIDILILPRPRASAMIKAFVVRLRARARLVLFRSSRGGRRKKGGGTQRRRGLIRSTVKRKFIKRGQHAWAAGRKMRFMSFTADKTLWWSWDLLLHAENKTRRAWLWESDVEEEEKVIEARFGFIGGSGGWRL